MSIKLYYMNLSPPSRAVLVTAKHLDIEVNIKELDLLKGEHLSEEFLNINPCHTVPTIVDGDFVLWESRPIMQYLCNKYSPDSSLYPREPQKRAIVDRMLSFDITYYTDIHDVLMKKFKGQEISEEDIERMKKSVKMMETLIGQNQYMAGDELTIADLSIGQSTSMMVFDHSKDLEDCPNLMAWFERLKQESNHFKQSVESAEKDIKNFMASQTKDQ